MRKLQNLVGIGWFALVGASACVSEEAGPSPSGPIATLSLANGAQIDFYEPMAGELVVFMKGDVGHDVDELAPLAIYEALAGAPAPAVLREAQARADQAIAARPPRGPATVDPVTEPERGGASLTASEFSSAWCNPSGDIDFDYCWTNATNNYSINITGVDWIHAHANAFAGILVMSMYKQNWFGSYELLFSDTVSGSATVVTQSASNDDFITDTYRVSLGQATGDGYHLSIHGAK